MVATLDILYIVLAICSLVVTAVIVVLGIEVTRAVREIQDISRNVSQISTLIERVAAIVFPGMERMARGADNLERKVADFLKKKAEKWSK